MTSEPESPPAQSVAETPRSYLVRTFGCQMNEHDSERLAGLLEAQGMVPAQDVEDADVVVFNTCCIRENADNRLYGNLGQLRALKQQRPGMQIAVGGCLAQKDREKVLETGAMGRRRIWDSQRRACRRPARACPQRTARRSRSSSRLLQARRSSLLLFPFVASCRSPHG